MRQPTSTSSYPDFVSLLGQLSRWPSDPLREVVSPKGMDFVQIECWQYPGTSDTVFKHQTSSDNELLAWLREQPPKHQGVEPSGGLKVLIAESAGYSALSDPVVDPSVRANSDIERESNILQKAVAAFGLPDSILNLFALGLNTPAFFETVPQAERGSTMFLDFPYHRVAWLHVQATSSTSALFMSDAKSQKLQGHMAFWIEQFRQLADAPMLLAYLTCFLAVRQTGNMLDSNFDDIRILELQTGHNRRTERIDLRPGQLPQLSSKASGMAAAGTSRGMDVKKICSSIKDILRIMRANRDLPDPKQAAHHEKTVYLISSTKSLQRVVEAQKSYAEELKQRAIVQQTALFQLLAQKDQQLGLQIASDSRVVAVEARKDSSSMKTIATMTLIFLPPTFISTIFSMSFFDWGSSKVVSSQFWIYWAIAVPFTMLVLSCWWVMLRLQNASEDGSVCLKPKSKISQDNSHPGN